MQVLAAQGDYREFIGADGRTIVAKLVAYDDLSKKVTVQPKGKGFKTVPLTLFSEIDQAYISSWKDRQDFLSATKLKVSVQRQKNKDEESSSISDDSTDNLYYDCSFILTFDNRSTTDFNDVKFEYVILYSQDRHTDGLSQKKSKNGSTYGRETISLPAKTTRDFETEKVVIYNYNTGKSGEKDLEGGVDGILVKLTWKSPSGDSVLREFRFPEHVKGIWRTKNINP